MIDGCSGPMPESAASSIQFQQRFSIARAAHAVSRAHRERRADDRAIRPMLSRGALRRARSGRWLFTIGRYLAELDWGLFKDLEP